MAQSLIPKTPKIIQRNSRSTQVGVAGQKIGFPIDRTGLIAELSLQFTVTGTHAAAVPTAIDVRQFIERLNLRSNSGDLIASLSGQQIFDISRLTENQGTPVISTFIIGVNTAIFQIDLHQEMDGAFYDLLTAINGSESTKLDLEIEITNATKANTIGWVGGGALSAFSVQCDVEVHQHPGMEHHMVDGIGMVGSRDHYCVSKELQGVATGRQTIELDPSCLTRFIGIHADTIAGGVNAAIPIDTLVTNVILKQGNKVLRETNFRSMRFLTQQMRGLNITGFAALDWDDFEGGFAALDGQPVQLQFDIATGSPAWRVQVLQDYSRDRPL